MTQFKTTLVFFILSSIFIIPLLLTNNIAAYKNSHNDLTLHTLMTNQIFKLKIEKIHYPPVVHFLSALFSKYTTLSITLSLYLVTTFSILTTALILGKITKNLNTLPIFILSSYFIYRSIIENHYALIFSLLPTVACIYLIKKKCPVAAFLMFLVSFFSYYFAGFVCILFYMSRNPKHILILTILSLPFVKFCYDLEKIIKVGDFNHLPYTNLFSISPIILFFALCNFKNITPENLRFSFYMLLYSLTFQILAYVNFIGFYYANKIGYYFIIPISLLIKHNEMDKNKLINGVAILALIHTTIKFLLVSQYPAL